MTKERIRIYSYDHVRARPHVAVKGWLASSPSEYDRLSGTLIEAFPGHRVVRAVLDACEDEAGRG